MEAGQDGHQLSTSEAKALVLTQSNLRRSKHKGKGRLFPHRGQEKHSWSLLIDKDRCLEGKSACVSPAYNLGPPALDSCLTELAAIANTYY
jgi:hypothetical protein